MSQTFTCESCCSEIRPIEDGAKDYYQTLELYFDGSLKEVSVRGRNVDEKEGLLEWMADCKYDRVDSTNLCRDCAKQFLSMESHQ